MLEMLCQVTSDGGVVVTKDPFSFSIVHISAEMAPIAKVGGLGDVVLGLARASTLKGHNVEVVLPGYNSVMKDVKVRTNQSTKSFQINKKGVFNAFISVSVVEKSLKIAEPTTR